MDTNVAQLKCSNNKCYALTFIYIYIDICREIGRMILM